MRNRYYIKFSKTGYVKYISHLDLLRLFKRAFKKTGIKLRYSEGFNPHPKLGFAQPLSLGYSSECELLEFETVENFKPEALMKLLSHEMPKGIDIIACDCLNYDFKSLAGETEACLYELFIPCDNCEMSDEKAAGLLDGYLAQPEITALKRMKKTKAYEPVNIKDKIRRLSVQKAGDFLRFTALLDGGSQSNLSPELVISSFLEYSKLPVERYDIEVNRKNIMFTNGLQF